MADRPNLLFYPPLASILAPTLAALLQWWFPFKVLPDLFSLWAFLVGMGLLLIALALAVSGTKAFKAAGTNVDPHQPALAIVRDGPYRFTRNPMYLGMIVLQFGLAFAFSLDWALAMAPFLLVLLHFGVVLREEAYLSEKFGDEYRAYLTETRRWL